VKPIALLAVLAALAFAQHWDIEQVDSAGWGAAVDMRWHPDGRLFLCYGDTSGVIRLASRDSVWSYEDLPQRRSVMPGTQAFDIGHRGTIGASYIGNDYHLWYALKADTGWADIQTPFYPYLPALTAFDTAGAPAITVQHGDAYRLARMRDTAWESDTLFTGNPSEHPIFGGCALGSRADGVVLGVFWLSFTWPYQDYYGTDLFSFYVGDSGLTINTIAGGYFDGIDGASGCVDRQGSVHSCYWYVPMSSPGSLCLDQTQVDTVRVTRTAVQFDSLDRPQIACVPSAGGLLYRYLDAGVWHIFDLQTTGVTALSLIIGENSQPLIAYATSDGVFLARGVDVVGLSNEQRGPEAHDSRPAATVVRNVLRIPASPSSVHSSLYDMTGRRIADLRPGANDLGGLSPGVYFVQESRTRAVRKVVLAR